jgi:hypothetical protein
MSKADDLLAQLEAILQCYQRSGEPLHTLGRRQPNWIADVDSEGIRVETKKSRGNPQLVKRQWLRDSITQLIEQETLIAESLPGSAHFRSAFVLAALSLLPGATHGSSPPSVTLRDC